MERLTNQTLLKSQIVLKQDMTQESQILNKTEQCTCILKNSGGYFHKMTNIAVTLRARDCNGFDNYGSNAVIEVSNGKSNK